MARVDVVRSGAQIVDALSSIPTALLVPLLPPLTALARQMEFLKMHLGHPEATSNGT